MLYYSQCIFKTSADYQVFCRGIINKSILAILFWYKSTIAMLVICNSPAIGSASQHNFMPVPSSGKWGGKPETLLNIPLKRGFCLLLFSSSYSYLKFFVLIHAWIAWVIRIPWEYMWTFCTYLRCHKKEGLIDLSQNGGIVVPFSIRNCNTHVVRVRVSYNTHHRWTLLHRNTLMPVLFVNVSEHAGTSEYRCESVEVS